MRRPATGFWRASQFCLVVLVSLIIDARRVAEASPAVRLLVTNDICAISICPATHPSPPTSVEAGQPFTLVVAALDAGYARDVDYRGTVSFSSSDPDAVIPGSYTFAVGDNGGKGFPAVLRTVGRQTITGTDVNGSVLPGTLTLDVTAPPQAIPLMSAAAGIVLALAVAAVGLWILRSS